MMSHAKPPFHYLGTCSKISLESFELSRLNRVANLRRELQETADEWIEAEVEARLARWLLEHRRGDPRVRFDNIIAISGAPEPSNSPTRSGRAGRAKRELPAPPGSRATPPTPAVTSLSRATDVVTPASTCGITATSGNPRDNRYRTSRFTRRGIRSL
ncbi:MAG: hypothetical protein WA755_04550 [Candidatus Acidiferrales bacterium]